MFWHIFAYFGGQNLVQQCPLLHVLQRHGLCWRLAVEMQPGKFQQNILHFCDQRPLVMILYKRNGKERPYILVAGSIAGSVLCLSYILYLL